MERKLKKSFCSRCSDLTYTYYVTTDNELWDSVLVEHNCEKCLDRYNNRYTKKTESIERDEWYAKKAEHALDRLSIFHGRDSRRIKVIRDYIKNSVEVKNGE